MLDTSLPLIPAPAVVAATVAAAVAEPPYVIVIGTSAGGMPALTELLCQLPASLPAAVLVVQHLAPDASGEQLIDRLNRQCSTGLRCHLARHGTPILAGHLYLAPPNRHLLVGVDGRLIVVKGPHENQYRPAADTLFRAAAVAYGARLIGVVLTGMLHDGTAGLEFVKRCGGCAVVQEPHDAEYASMPESALRNVDVDYVVPLAAMGALLERLVAAPLPAPAVIPEDLQIEAGIAGRVVGATAAVVSIGTLLPLTCPSCGGNLWEMKHGTMLRYRCHTGHAFTAEAMMGHTQKALEETLWVSLRMLEERKNLLASMAARGLGLLSVQQGERIEEMKHHINRLREFLLNGAGSGEDSPAINEAKS